MALSSLLLVAWIQLWPAQAAPKSTEAPQPRNIQQIDKATPWSGHGRISHAKIGMRPHWAPPCHHGIAPRDINCVYDAFFLGMILGTQISWAHPKE
jgi:hypothetical protein